MGTPKEATIIIIDVGKPMGGCNHGRPISDLDWAMQYVWDKIISTVATGRKTLYLALVGLKTDNTENVMWDSADEEEKNQYKNITVFHGLEQVLMPDIWRFQALIKPNETEAGDALSAVIVGIQMISTKCEGKKFIKKIVLVTDGKGNMDSEGVTDIGEKLREDNIELVLVGVDFDDPDSGFKEEDKGQEKAANERTLKQLVNDAGGVFGTLEDVIRDLEVPNLKTINSRPSPNELKLGDANRFPSGLTVQVDRYLKTTPSQPPRTKTFVIASDAKDAESSHMEERRNGPGLTPVNRLRSYQIEDDEAPGGKRDVKEDELAKGFEYGKTAVHISKADENITKLEVEVSLDILGFIASEKYERYMNVSISHVVVGRKDNDKAKMVLSSIIHSMSELECYAVGRLVATSVSDPSIVVLAPSIEPDFECLMEVQVPFSEDVRSYRFPPLDKVITVSGKEITEHRNLPSEKLLTAMDDYVTTMSLEKKPKGGERFDLIPMEECYSPLNYSIEKAISSRILNPTAPVPSFPQILEKERQQPEELQEKSKPYLDYLKRVADVKKVPPKAKGRKRARETEKPLSGLDVEGLLRGEDRQRISPRNAIPEFKQALLWSVNMESVNDSVEQMASIVEDQIRYSLGDANYERVVEYLGVVREEMIDYEAPDIYNRMIKSLKHKLLRGELGGDRREMWWLLKRRELGLIDKERSEWSAVTEDEARRFLVSHD